MLRGVLKFFDRLSDASKLVIAISGIYSCYIFYGICQEGVYSYKSEKTGEKFSFTLFFLLTQCSVNCLIATLFLAIFGGSQHHPPTKDYAKIGFSYVFAMLASNEALKYVSYPTQALGKSCKMIPVMLFGILRGKRYSALEIIAVLTITVGISLFQYKAGGHTSLYGILLLFVSLILDGVTGSSQDAVQEKFRLTTHEMMLNTNLWAAIFLVVPTILSGQGSLGIQYCIENPSILSFILAAGITSAIGQNFIFFTVINFNALILAAVTTTRKFFTVLLSIFLFNHSLDQRQWVGVIIVFAGLLLEMYVKQQGKKKKGKPDSHKSKDDKEHHHEQHHDHHHKSK